LRGLAFGKFFTLLDPIYRKRGRLEISEHSVTVPYTFRVLATMNSYDRALLFKLGYALTRGFAIISRAYLQNLAEYCKEYVERALKR
jgi:hypothetical protein